MHHLCIIAMYKLDIPYQNVEWMGAHKQSLRSFSIWPGPVGFRTESYRFSQIPFRPVTLNPPTSGICYSNGSGIIASVVPSYSLHMCSPMFSFLYCVHHRARSKHGRNLFGTCYTVLLLLHVMTASTVLLLSHVLTARLAYN